jgi:hypothetical protein
LVGAQELAKIIIQLFIKPKKEGLAFKPTQKSLWNTALSDLIFTTGGSNQHNLYLPGKDLGNTVAGYNQNFAWGKMDLTNQSLSLYDGNTDPGGALYLGAILGVVLNGSQATNIIGNGFDIYYDPTMTNNAYLGGLTYNLQDGGVLAPAVPLPASAWLFLSGLVGLGLLGRKRKGKTS